MFEKKNMKDFFYEVEQRIYPNFKIVCIENSVLQKLICTEVRTWPLFTSFTRFCSSSCVSAQQISWPLSSVVTVNSTKFHMSSSLWRERSLQGRHMVSGWGTTCFSFLSFCHTITTVNTIINNKTFRIIITTARFLHLILFCAGVSSLVDPSVFSDSFKSRNFELSLLESILDRGG